jgi:hypothetical protein
MVSYDTDRYKIHISSKQTSTNAVVPGDDDEVEQNDGMDGEVKLHVVVDVAQRLRHGAEDIAQDVDLGSIL